MENFKFSINLFIFFVSIIFINPHFAFSEVAEADNYVFAANELDDPLSWLEGPPDCRLIQDKVKIRYKITEADLNHLPKLLEEEFRHIQKETCNEVRFDQCDFFWCSDKVKSVVDIENQPELSLPTSVVKNAVAKQISNNTELLGNTEVGSDKKNESSDIELALAKGPVSLENNADRQVHSIDTVNNIQVANNAGSRARLTTSPLVLENSNSKVNVLPRISSGANITRIAEERLSATIEEKFKNQRKLIKLRSEDEAKAGLNWVQITVPGAERLFRSSGRGNKLVQEKNGNLNRDYARSIAPGIDSHGDVSTTGEPVTPAGAYQPQQINPNIPGNNTGGLNTNLDNTEEDKYLRTLTNGINRRNALGIKGRSKSD